jgi:hypothetical protein
MREEPKPPAFIKQGGMPGLLCPSPPLLGERVRERGLTSFTSFTFFTPSRIPPPLLYTVAHPDLQEQT